jgi:hypothetical protein
MRDVTISVRSKRVWMQGGGCDLGWGRLPAPLGIDVHQSIDDLRIPNNEAL